MKREAPSDREIVEMIAPAFDRLPVPDSRRLAAIEERLMEQPRLRRRSKIAWWWLAAALVAGAASALWWAVDYDSGNGQEESVPAVMSSPATLPREKHSVPDRPAGVEPESAGGEASKKGPEIYRRER